MVCEEFLGCDGCVECERCLDCGGCVDSIDGSESKNCVDVPWIMKVL